jgi:hypothetical protein
MPTDVQADSCRQAGIYKSILRRPQANHSYHIERLSTTLSAAVKMRVSTLLNPFLVALLAAPLLTHAWVLSTTTLPKDIDSANKQVLRWGFPNAGQDRSLSLGQGSLYSISPEFLVDMVPLFPREVLSADYMKESIGRGFSTWESNNIVSSLARVRPKLRYSH